HAKFGFQPRQQLHALETAEPKITIEMRGRGKRWQHSKTAQFFEQRAHYVDNALSHVRPVELWCRCRHRWKAGTILRPEATTRPVAPRPCSQMRTKSAFFERRVNTYPAAPRFALLVTHPLGGLLLRLAAGWRHKSARQKRCRQIHTGKIDAVQIRLAEDRHAHV